MFRGVPDCGTSPITLHLPPRFKNDRVLLARRGLMPMLSASSREVQGPSLSTRIAFK